MDAEAVLAAVGDQVWDALQAFSSDIRYFEEMIYTANLIEYKRDYWDVRNGVKTERTVPKPVNPSIHEKRVRTQRVLSRTTT